MTHEGKTTAELAAEKNTAFERYGQALEHYRAVYAEWKQMFETAEFKQAEADALAGRITPDEVYAPIIAAKARVETAFEEFGAAFRDWQNAKRMPSPTEDGPDRA
jgi:hypothetical protein